MSIISYAQLAAEAIEDNLIEEATHYITLSLEQDEVTVKNDLGDYLFTKGFLEEAKRVFLHLVQMHETNEANILRLAEIYIEEGNDDDALDQLLSLAPSSPYYLESLMIQADLYQTQGLYEVSEQKLQEAYQMASDEPVILFALAELHFEQGNYTAAIREYKELLSQGITELVDVSILSRMAEATSLIGNWEEAVSLYKQLVLEQETTENNYQLAFTYFQLEEFDQTIDYLKKAEALDPSYTTMYPLLVESYLKKGLIAQAKDALERGLAYDQTNAHLFLSGANVFKEEGDLERASELLEKGLALDPEQIEKLDLADIMEQQSDVEKALAVLGNDADESDPLVLWKRAGYKEEMEEFAEAGKDYKKASVFLLGNEQFVKDYILFLRDEGEWTAAKEYLEQAKQEPSVPEETLSFLESIIRKP